MQALAARKERAIPMGLFDGFLFCSDIDGTLTEGTAVSKENRDAIAHFRAEGGCFVFATGRYAAYPQQVLHMDPAGPIISLNGTLVIDSRTGSHLRAFPLTAIEKDAASALAAEGWAFIAQAILHHADCNIPCTSPAAFDAAFRTVQEKNAPLYKVVFCTESEEDALKLRAMGSALFGRTVTLCRTWSTGVELYRADAGKSTCLQYLRDVLPGITKTVAVGDYENDAAMIAAADYGFAPVGAIPEALHAARFTAPPCREHAIAYIVRKLERLCIEGTLL